MQVAVLIAGEQVSEGSLAHLQSRLLDSLELIHNISILQGLIGNSSNDIARLVIAALENEPSRRLRKTHDEEQNEDTEDNLECQRESPRHRSRGEGETKIDPV